MPAHFRVTFITDGETEKRVKELADKEGKSVSGMINDMVSEYIEIDWEKHKELSRIGSVWGIRPTQLVNKMYTQKINSISGCLGNGADV